MFPRMQNAGDSDAAWSSINRVRLAEGPILLTHLEGIANPVCDQPVRIAWRPLPSGRHLPVFRSADDGF